MLRPHPCAAPGWSVEGVLTEYQIHFSDDLSAVRWLTANAQSPDRLVWGSTGLSVAFIEIRSRGQLDVDVVQVCIRGKKPQHLSGPTIATFRSPEQTAAPHTLCHAPIRDQSTTTSSKYKPETTESLAFMQ